LIFFIVKKLFRKKVILHIHGGYYLMHKCSNKVINFLLKKDFKYAEAIIVLSDLEKEILSKAYGNLSFHVFPNAVDIIMVNGLRERPLHPHIRFVFMARIIEKKGIYTISESLQYLTRYFNRFSLDIYGAGPDLMEWMARLKKYPALKYYFKGVVGGQDKWNALKCSDVLLLPSLDGEGMPIVMIEAMAVGCVVIVTDIASVKSVITDNVNGILLPESDPKQLAQRIQDIIEGSLDLNTIGQNAKEYVNSNLSLSGYITRLEQLYATL
jgi:glycosyltransferase involved in cell wall biosynthesis